MGSQGLACPLPEKILYLLSSKFTISSTSYYLKEYSVNLTTFFYGMNQKIKNKKNFVKFSKFQLIPIFCFQVRHDYCVFHCSHRLLCWIKSCVQDFLWYHFILKWFQPNSFGEACSLEESYENLQKIQILKILRAPSIRHQGVCL